MANQTTKEKAMPAPNPPPRELDTKETKFVDYTKIPQKNAIKFRYEWNVSNFHTHLANKIRFLKSPLFSTADNDQLKWSVILFPFGVQEQEASHSSVYLCLEACDKAEVTVEFSLSHNAASERAKILGTSEVCVFKNDSTIATFGFENFMDMNWRNYYQNVGRMWMHCEVEVYYSIVDTLQASGADSANIAYGSLLDGMRFIFDAPKYSDFTIAVHGQEFPVHKEILSARSSVLAAMFEHDTQERQTNRLDIKDATPEVVKEMLRFIYTDDVMNIETVAYDLLAVANKYALHRLKIVCENALRDSLTAQNAMQILIAADLHNAYRLRDATMKFITMDAIRVMDSEDFETVAVSHPKLMIPLMRAIATKNERPTVKKAN